MYFLTKFSLGNFGGASVQCITKEVLVSKFDLHCDVGRLDMQNIKFGVMSNQIAEPFFCEEEAIWKSAANKNKGFAHCTDNIDTQTIKDKWVNLYQGKVTATINFGQSDLYSPAD
jgi:hypothetical protein